MAKKKPVKKKPYGSKLITRELQSRPPAVKTLLSLLGGRGSAVTFSAKLTEFENPEGDKTYNLSVKLVLDYDKAVEAIDQTIPPDALVLNTSDVIPLTVKAGSDDKILEGAINGLTEKPASVTARFAFRSVTLTEKIEFGP